MQPYLVYDSLAIRKTERVFSRTVAAKITEAMILAVNNGTASLAQVSVAVAGKTGTAQSPAGEDHSWFIGFAPRTHLK